VEVTAAGGGTRRAGCRLLTQRWIIIMIILDSIGEVHAEHPAVDLVHLHRRSSAMGFLSPSWSKKGVCRCFTVVAL
jgi:hypothetical protein